MAKEMVKTVCCLIGVSGSGKSTVARDLEQYAGFKVLRSYTTRPKRNELDTDHTFISDEEYDHLADKIAETHFNDYRYCATLEQLEASDIYIIDVPGWFDLKKNLAMQEADVRVFSVQLKLPPEEAKKRMQIRGDSARKIASRLANDAVMFPEGFEADYTIDASTDSEDVGYRLFSILRKEQGYITKQDVLDGLEKGGSLEKILSESCGHITEGQECLIYKAPWTGYQEAIVYIPDFDLNELKAWNIELSAYAIQNIINHCYTVYDFMNEAFFNEKTAYSLYCGSDWANPNIQDLMDCTDEEEALADYGETWQQMQERSSGIYAGQSPDTDEITVKNPVPWMLEAETPEEKVRVIQRAMETRDINMSDEPKAIDFYYEAAKYGIDNVYDADSCAWLNTLFGYDIGFKAGLAIEREYWNQTDNSTAELDHTDKELIQEIASKLGLGLDFSNWAAKRPPRLEFDFAAAKAERDNGTNWRNWKPGNIVKFCYDEFDGYGEVYGIVTKVTDKCLLAKEAASSVNGGKVMPVTGEPQKMYCDDDLAHMFFRVDQIPVE